MALAGGARRRGRSTWTHAVATFHAEHEREYYYRRDDAPVEIYRLNVQAIGVTPKAELRAARADGGDAARAARRRATCASTASAVDTPVYARDDLPAGVAFEGPAMIDQLDSTDARPARRRRPRSTSG